MNDNNLNLEFKCFTYKFETKLQFLPNIYRMSSEDSYQERFMKFLNEMHFESQPAAQKLFKSAILTVAILSYIVASIFQRFSICIYSILAVTIVCVVVAVPGGWSWWQRPMPAFAKAKSN